MNISKNLNIKYIDVSDLPAPEPLEKTLELLTSSSKFDIICMIHRQPPHLLFDILKERGYLFSIDQKDKQFNIHIWHSENQEALDIINGNKRRV